VNNQNSKKTSCLPQFFRKYPKIIFFRFVYPERPTLYFSLCYLVISLAVMAGLIAPDQIACNTDTITADDLDPGLTNGIENTKCTIVFGIVYFFTSTYIICFFQ